MATDSTLSTGARRPRRQQEVTVYGVGRRIMARRVGKIRGKGKREVTSSSSATSRRDLPPHLPPYLSEASCLLDKFDKELLIQNASAQTQQQPDVEPLSTTMTESSIQIPPLTLSWLPSLSSFVQKQLSDMLSEKSVGGPASGQTLHQNLHDAQRDTIWVREQHDWGLTFYTRIDLRGYFCTYPKVGGPFNSLEEASNAIDRYLHDRQDPMMRKEQHEFYEVGKASVERGIRACLYWPDGSKKMHVISEQIDKSHCKMLQLVQALVDMYNEDPLHFEDIPFELKDVVCSEVIYEGDRCYYHTNFTTKTKGPKTTDNLFFAEVTHMPGEDGKLVVSCICRVDTFDNGQCYGCGSNMKHPNADAYNGGHSKDFKFFHIGDGCRGPNIDTAKTMDDWKAEEARVRRLFEGLDDPSVVARLMEPPKFEFGANMATDEEVDCFMESIMGPYNGSTDIIDASTAERFRVQLK